jgi:hypothetical protein
MKINFHHPGAFFLIAVFYQPLCLRGGDSGCLRINRIFHDNHSFTEEQICRRRSAIADRSAWTSSHWSNFSMQTNGPQGGDGIALARNSIGHVFVGRREVAFPGLRMTANPGRGLITD